MLGKQNETEGDVFDMSGFMMASCSEVAGRVHAELQHEIPLHTS